MTLRTAALFMSAALIGSSPSGADAQTYKLRQKLARTPSVAAPAVKKTSCSTPVPNSWVNAVNGTTDVGSAGSADEAARLCEAKVTTRKGVCYWLPGSGYVGFAFDIDPYPLPGRLDLWSGACPLS